MELLVCVGKSSEIGKVSQFLSIFVDNLDNLQVNAALDD